MGEELGPLPFSPEAVFEGCVCES
ncbi:unnamed protein product [Linum tenue]|uniref:Uncharacterized protein n=1 Tax=Linum tenue TaxID=586396 RepID=A0AAV0H8V0_9ROSI|nr:unnamed protein product [Linum tenue]